MSPESHEVRGFLGRAARRRTALLALQGAGAGVAAALALLGACWIELLSRPVALGAGLGAVAAGAAAGVSRALGTRGIAHAVERRAPACRNLLVTAAELLDPAERHTTRPAVVHLVVVRAARLVQGLDPAALFPLAPAVATLVAGTVAWAGLAAVTPEPAITASRTGVAVPAADATPAIDGLEVVVTPPPYSGRPPRAVAEPERLEVLAGSRLEVRVTGTAAGVTLTTLEGSRELERGPAGAWSGSMVADADGFLALEARGRSGERLTASGAGSRVPDAGAAVTGTAAGATRPADGAAGTAAASAPSARRLVGLVVVPDASPVVRIIEPGRDLFLTDAGTTIAVTATARDDLGLDDLGVTYTLVSGSGEAFEFTEGELDVRVERQDDRAWAGTAVLSLPELGLSLGDMVVYRAVARDLRPGAAAVESDAFVVEVVSSDAAIAGGFAVESDEERSAISQRMVIIETERLLARKGSASADEYADGALRLAALQRTVRAEFVFMMGGEVQDEFEEAAHEHEIAAGRLEHRGRVELTRAVLAMSQAAAALTEADLEAALPLEEEALEALQRALARSRYILRTLGGRERIDLARRMTGESGPTRGPRAGVATDPDPEIVGLRRLLADAASLAARPILDRQAAPALADLAEAVLRLDPSSVELQEVAAELAAAARQADGGDPAGARRRLDAVIDTLTRRLGGSLLMAPAPRAGDAALAGALADELAGAGGGR